MKKDVKKRIDSEYFREMCESVKRREVQEKLREEKLRK